MITIDLNPLSRTAQTAHVTIVDELTRCLPLLTESVRVGAVVEDFDNEKNLQKVIDFISDRLSRTE